MKTTLEIPDVLFRRVGSKAAERGQTRRDFVSEALQEKLARRTGTGRPGEPEWMQGFGKLRRLHEATERRRPQPRSGKLVAAKRAGDGFFASTLGRHVWGRSFFAWFAR